MARSATTANQDANTQYTNYENQAAGNYNKQMQGFSTNLSGMQANNPYTSHAYLQNQGKLASAAMNSADASAKSNLLETAGRTGTNTAALGNTIASNARAGQRQNDAFNAETATQNTDKSAAYQESLLRDQLAGANSEAGMFGANVTGRSDSLNNLTSIQNADQQMWGNVIGGVAGGAGAAFAGKA